EIWKFRSAACKPTGMNKTRLEITDLNVARFCSSLRSHLFGNGNGPMQPTGTAVSPKTSKDLSRRCFLRTSVVATAGTLVGLGANFAGPRPVFQTTLSPEAALNELIEGNQRYATGSMTAHEHDLQVLKAKTAEKQQPFAAVLSCADSRVPVELLFDQ